jgi:hypothetical protein
MGAHSHLAADFGDLFHMRTPAWKLIT